MKIEIWSDFSCPFCYIGKKRFEQALSMFEHKEEVSVVFKAYQLDPQAEKQTSENAYELFSKSHQITVSETKKKFSAVSESAKTVGLTFNYDIVKMTNTYDAHRLAKWAFQYGLDQVLTERLMKAYFSEGANLADHETLVALASECGLNKDEAALVLSENRFASNVKDDIFEAKKIGVQGVPFFVVNRKYGISGAQQTDYFLAALEQIWDEEHGLIDLSDEGESCSDGSCCL